MSFDGKCPGTNAVADALGTVAPPVTRLAVDLVLVVAMRPHLQFFLAIFAVEASFVEDFVRGGTFFRRIDGLLASHAFFTAAESERFSCKHEIARPKQLERKSKADARIE